MEEKRRTKSEKGGMILAVSVMFEAYRAIERESVGQSDPGGSGIITRGCKCSAFSIIWLPVIKYPSPISLGTRADVTYT